MKKQRDRNGVKRKKRSNVCALCLHCVQMNKNKIHIWLVWHRIIHLFGWNKTPSVAYYIHSITSNKMLECSNKPTTMMMMMMQSVLRSIYTVCIVLVGASAACVLFCRRSRRYWFCFIIFCFRYPRMNQDRMADRECGCVCDYLCAQFLVRFINDVTFNICETWRAKLIPIYGLFFAVCFYRRPQLLIVL